MTIKSKRTLTSIILNVILLLSYYGYIYFFKAETITDLKTLSRVILFFIVIAIVLQIIIMILFHIGLAVGLAVKQGSEKDIERTISSSMIEDEMDKIINHKAMKIYFILLSIGILASLILLAIGFSGLLMLNIIYTSLVVGLITEGGVSIYLYEKGLIDG